jgi:N utilization substance protein A
VKETDLTRLGNVAGIGIKKARQVKAAAEHYLQEEARRRTELDALKKAAVPPLP